MAKIFSNLSDLFLKEKQVQNFQPQKHNMVTQI